MDPHPFGYMLVPVLTALLCGVPATAAAAFPENDLHLQDDINSIASFTEDEFNTTLAELEVLFRPLFFFHGGRLVVERLWTSNVVNAFAKRVGHDWIVEMHGGLARRPEITVDGLSFVVCHEIGHHLGGYLELPRFGRQI